MGAGVTLLLLDEATEGGVPLWYLPKRLWLSVGKFGGVEEYSLVERDRRVWFEVEDKRFGVWLAKLEAAVHAPHGLLIPAPTAPSWEWAAYWVDLGKTLPSPPKGLAWPVYVDRLAHLRDANDVRLASEAREIAPRDQGRHILALAAAVNLAAVGSLLRSKDGLHPRDYTSLMTKEQRAAAGAKMQNPHDARIEALSLLMTKAEGAAKGSPAAPPPSPSPPPPPPPPPAGFGELETADGGTAALHDDDPYQPLPEDDYFGQFSRDASSNPSLGSVSLNDRRAAVPLATLGRLTFLRTTRAAYRWSLRAAPLLVYAPATGRLFIAYQGRILRPMTSTEAREYKRTHWGQPPPEGHVRAAGVAPGPWGRAEEVQVIAYTTRKGADPALVDYVHEFGEGAARGARVVKPRLVAHRCKGGCRATCAAAGAYALLGGTYHVDTRGIVG